LSGRFRFEGESGLAEESGDEGGLSLDVIQLVPQRGGELAGGTGGQVAQAVVYHRPGAFDRVQVSGVGGSWITVSQSGWPVVKARLFLLRSVLGLSEIRAP
jgi:hypothetical protein